MTNDDGHSESVRSDIVGDPNAFSYQAPQLHNVAVDRRRVIDGMSEGDAWLRNDFAILDINAERCGLNKNRTRKSSAARIGMRIRAAKLDHLVSVTSALCATESPRRSSTSMLGTMGACHGSTCVPVLLRVTN